MRHIRNLESVALLGAGAPGKPLSGSPRQVLWVGDGAQPLVLRSHYRGRGEKNHGSRRQAPQLGRADARRPRPRRRRALETLRRNVRHDRICRAVAMVIRTILFEGFEPLPERLLGPCQAGTEAPDPHCQRFESVIDGRRFVTSRSARLLEVSARRVPNSHVYVMGDHRDRSNDSRNPAVGMIPLDMIKGRGLSIYWSRSDDGLRWDRMLSNVH
jgi:hypothetical protein